MGQRSQRQPRNGPPDQRAVRPKEITGKRHPSTRVRRVAARGPVEFVYEAGPCGYEVHRQITALGQTCTVIAPALTPVRPGDRVKTDRRDAEKLARYQRAGELTAIRVPTREEEAARDLVRVREDGVSDRLRARHRLAKFFLRQGRVYRETKSWGVAHRAWVKSQRFEWQPLQQGFEANVRAVEEAEARLAVLDQQLQDLAQTAIDWEPMWVPNPLPPMRPRAFTKPELSPQVAISALLYPCPSYQGGREPIQQVVADSRTYMRISLLPLTLALAPACHAQGTLHTDPCPTASSLTNVAADNSFDRIRIVFDGGAGPTVNQPAVTLRNPIGPRIGSGTAVVVEASAKARAELVASRALSARRWREALPAGIEEVDLASRVTFGPEFTFGNARLSRSWQAAAKRDEAQTGEVVEIIRDKGNQAALTQLVAAVQKRCGPPLNRCRVVPGTDKYGLTVYRVEYPDGWWFQLTTDPGVIEAQAKPSTLGEMVAHRNDLRFDLFGEAAKHKLFADPTSAGGGGHINIGVQSAFGDDVLLFRNFIVDMVNHHELFQGILENDLVSAPTLVDKGPEALELFRRVIAQFDSGELGHTIRDLAATIEDAVYAGEVKYQSISLTSIVDPNVPANLARVELRGVRAQANMEQFFWELRLFDRRLKHLRGLDEPLPVEPFAPLTDAQKLRRFNNFLVETGLPVEPYDRLPLIGRLNSIKN